MSTGDAYCISAILSFVRPPQNYPAHIPPISFRRVIKALRDAATISSYLINK
jgi:hypothetical protein